LERSQPTSPTTPRPHAAVRPLEEGLYRTLVESIRDYAVFVIDPKGVVLSWNIGAQRIKGYEADEIVGCHFSLFYPPEDAAAGKPQRGLMVAEAEGRFEDEGWRVRKDGSRFWASVVITALHDPQGGLLGFAKVTRDLTDRWLADQALRQSEERFRLIVQSVRDYGIFMLDPEGRVASWNEGAEAIKGYRASDIIGQHFSAFYPEEDRAAGKPDHELEVATATGRFEDEGWRVRKDGSLFWANVVITALRGEDGHLVGFAKVTRDLTERRASQERALADARRVAEAEASNRAKGEFLASLSHELRTPLNAIGGYVDLMLEGIRGPLTKDQTQDLSRIRRSQTHLLGIINDLLNFSRIEAGRLEYDIEAFAIDDLMDAVRAMIEPLAARKDIEMGWPEHIPRECALADFLKTQQILINLLTNAIKFTGQHGRVWIELEVESAALVMTVKDTGMGIPPEKQDQIFEPFVQVGRSLTSGHEGSGLGLAISRDLARAMKGELTVTSRLGAGSSFRLTVPRAGAAAAAS
jgi:PAS domain S-box-containing protein